MKVNTVSFSNTKSSIAVKNNKTADFSSPKKSSIPSFSAASLGILNEAQIKSLYMDGPGLSELVKEVLPLLAKKFNGFFNAILDIKPDVNRTIQVKVKTNLDKFEELKKYIVNNNKKFEFPTIMIADFKEGGKAGFDRWLYEDRYIPLSFSLDSAGNIKNAKKVLLDFTKDIDNDKIIADMYNVSGREFKVGKQKVPSYYWEFPGG